MSDAKNMIISTMMISFLLYSFEGNGLKDLSNEEKGEKIQELFSRYADNLITALDAGGFIIVPKDKADIPNAFKY